MLSNTKVNLQQEMLSPVCRAEYYSFWREQPARGAAWMPHVDRGAGSPFCRPTLKAVARRIKAAAGSPFLWLLSFGEAKESNSPSGTRTRLNQSVTFMAFHWEPRKTMHFDKLSANGTIQINEFRSRESLSSYDRNGFFEVPHCTSQ